MGTRLQLPIMPRCLNSLARSANLFDLGADSDDTGIGALGSGCRRLCPFSRAARVPAHLGEDLLMVDLNLGLICFFIMVPNC